MGNQLVKQFVKLLLSYGGWYSVHELLKDRRNKRLLVLMYHNLSEQPLSPAAAAIWPGLPSRQQFAAHLDAILARYQVLTLEDALTEIDRTGKLADDTIAITFDDGYQSTYSIAFPELRDRNLTATVYLITDWIDGKSSPWWIALSELALAASFESSHASQLGEILDDPVDPAAPKAGDSIEWRSHFFRRAERSLRLSDAPTCQQRLTALYQLLLPGASPTTGVSLSWDQAREMSAAGIRFGAHTQSHPNFETMTAEAIGDEIVSSRNIISRQLNQPVVGFAFPYGTDLATYRKLESIFRQNDFQYAVTAYHGSFEPHFDRYLIRRATLPAETNKALLRRALVLNLLTENPVAPLTRSRLSIF